MKPINYATGKVFLRLICFTVFVWSIAVTADNARAAVEIQGMLVSFHNLAVMDCTAAMDVWASKEARAGWKRQAEPVLGDRLLANAFFEPALALAGPENEGVSIAGVFNPWVDALLILSIEKQSAGFRINDFNLVIKSSQETLPVNADPADLAALISYRIQRVREELAVSSENWSGMRSQNTSGHVWQELKDALVSRIQMMRSVLSPQGEKRYQTMRDTFGQVMRSLRDGKGDVGIVIPKGEPGDWRLTLQPVHLEPSGRNLSVFFFSRPFPENLYWILLDDRSKKPVVNQKLLPLRF